MIKINDLDKLIINYTKQHLKKDLFNYQTHIINTIIDKKYKKITIRAATRIGKSYALAIAAILFALFYPNSKIGIIAPTRDKTKIIMTYILELLSDSDLGDAIDLDLMGLTKLERLKKEVSKSKITFKTGSYIEIKTADVKNKGFSLMGFGYDLIIIDESGELNDEVYSKIYRMLLQNVDTKIVESGNPWFLNHFYKHSLSDDWYQIHIPSDIAIKEGRLSQEQIDDQKRNLTKPEIKVLLDAEFPEELENSLINLEDITKAQRDIPVIKQIPEYILGIDVARLGNDSTIIYLVERYDSLFIVKDTFEFKKQRLTKTAGNIIDILKAHKIDRIVIDSTGLGGGLDDMLQEYIDNEDLNIVINSIVFGSKADDEHNINKKADIYFNLERIFKSGNIIIPKDNVLVLQLRQIQFEITSNGKKKINDNQEKSPDRADALALACYREFNNVFVDFGKPIESVII